MVASIGIKYANKPAGAWLCSACRQRPKTSTRSSSESISKGDQPYQFRKTAIRQYASATANKKQDNSRRNGHLPDSPARTRFAPSPTGYTHVGGLRTALFSYLLARRTKGQFLLRIEDTDQTRLVSDAEARLCEDLHWAGLRWDEGPDVNGPFGPYRQSERTEIYQEHAQHLINTGAAYRCFCTPQNTGIRGVKASFVTSGCYQDCSSIPFDQAQERAESKRDLFTVRLRQPADVRKRVYKDVVYGTIQRLQRSSSAGSGDGGGSGLDAADAILVKSDGMPTYHFANVVDDHLMQITHVIRGSEWMASTPLHYDLYTAFGWKPPTFAHVALLIDEKSAKLSKRSDTGLVLDVKAMREREGILPEALCNFLALLGWSSPGRDDVLEMNELIRDFDLKFTKGNTMVKLEKLWFLQRQHVARKRQLALSQSSPLPLADIANSVSVEAQHSCPNIGGHNSPNHKTLEEFCVDLLLVDFKSYQTPKQYVQRNRYFFAFDAGEVPEQQALYGESPDLTGANLAGFMDELLTAFDWAQPYRTSTTAKAPEASQPVPPLLQSIEQAATRIHAAIDIKIWERILEKIDHSDATDASGVIPFTVDHVNNFATAHFIAKRTIADASETDVDAKTVDLVDQYKGWNKALMRYLREKLAYGLPGPGVGHVMALLGYEECCRRLGAEPQKDSGW